MSRIVVVLGGNAFVAPGHRLTMEGQLLKSLAHMPPPIERTPPAAPGK